MSPYKFVNKILNTDEEIEYICSTLYKHIKQGRKGDKLTSILVSLGFLTQLT